jgi:hypothetical protein
VGKDLSNGYFNDSGPIVEEQIVRAGLRMAAWLHGIAKEVRPRKLRDNAAGEL